MMNKLIISFICMLCSVILNATNTCPIVYDGNKVLFRVKNPNAKAVYLSGSMLPIKKKIKTPVGTFGKHGDVLMTLNNDDWWEYSIDSVPPGLYTYKFKIDDDKEQIDSLVEFGTIEPPKKEEVVEEKEVKSNSKKEKETNKDSDKE